MTAPADTPQRCEHGLLNCSRCRWLHGRPAGLPHTAPTAQADSGEPGAVQPAYWPFSTWVAHRPFVSHGRHAQDYGEYRHAAGRTAERERLLRLDTPWPTQSFVHILTEAARHLLLDHSCDKHGYESVAHAINAADEWLCGLDAARKGEK